MNRWTRRAAVLALAAVGTLAGTVASADTAYRIIVPSGPGTGNDVIFRAFAPLLAAELGQPVIVDNRSGADGAIAVKELDRTPKDGHTLLAVTDNMITMNHLITSYDPKVIRPAVWIMRTTAVLVGNPNGRYKTLDEMLVAAREKPDTVAIGIGAGVYRFNLALMESATKTRFREVPYAGTATNMITDLIGGNIDATLLELGGALPQIQGGRLKALAVLGPERSPMLPNVPTIAGSIYPNNYSMNMLFGLAVNSATPDPVYKDVSAAIQRAARSKTMQEFINNRGQNFYGASGDEVAPSLEKSAVQFKQLVTTTNILSRAQGN